VGQNVQKFSRAKGYTTLRIQESAAKPIENSSNLTHGGFPMTLQRGARLEDSVVVGTMGVLPWFRGKVMGLGGGAV